MVAQTNFSSPCTITSNVQESVFPEPSVAVYVTVVVPMENSLPLLCELWIPTLSLLSVALGAAHVALTVALLAPTANVMLLGQFSRTGASSSVQL